MSATQPEHTPHEPHTTDAEVIELPTQHRGESETESEVVEAEIIDHDPDPDGQQEPEQERPAPSTEVATRPRTTATIVPTSVRTAATRASEACKRPDRIALELLRHELIYGSVGTARGAGSLWRWMTAAELDTQLAVKPELVLTTRKKRRNIVLAGAGTTAAVGTAAWFLLTPAVPILAILTVLAVAGGLERRRAALGDAEAGHKALGPSPSGKEVKRTFVAARLAKNTDEIRIVGPVARTDGAWEATLELPQGTTYKTATKRRGEIAAAIGVDEVQVALDPIKGHNGRVRIWVADEDPMQGGAVVSPLLTRTKPTDFWTDKVYAGKDARGRDVEFSLVERSYLVGGEPGGGKSVACNNILAFAAMDPNVRLWLADGKGGFDLADFEPVAERVLAEPDHDEMMEMIADLQAEMGRRYAKLRKTGYRKVTKDVARKLDMPPILFHIDEIQKFALGDGDTKKGKAFITGVADIVGRGRAAGIITGAVTQRPAADVVPTRLRDILSIRWALRCTTAEASDTVLGSGRAAQGYSSAMFTADQRGAGYLLSEGASPVQERTAFMDDDEVAGIARRAYELRKDAGTLPKTDERTDVRVLNAVLEAMAEADKIHSDVLVAHLAKREEFADLTQEALAKILRPLGVVTKGVWATKFEDPATKTTRQGYEKEAVLAALERV